MDLFNSLRVATNTGRVFTEGFRQHSADIGSAQNADYHRQEIGFVSSGNLRGSRLAAVRRANDENLQRQILETLSEQGFATTLENYGTVLAEAAGLNRDQPFLSEAYDDLLSALEELQIDPSSTPAQQNVIDRAGDLAAEIRNFARAIRELESRISQDVTADVETINSSLVRIRDLNVDIQRRRVQNLSTSGLEGERDALLRQIAEIVPIQTLVTNDYGGIDIFLNSGHSLLSGRNISTLRFEPGARALFVDGRDAPLADAEGRSEILGGALAAKLDLLQENTPTTTHTLNETQHHALLAKLRLQLDGVVLNLTDTSYDPSVPLSVNEFFEAIPTRTTQEWPGILFSSPDFFSPVTTDNISVNPAFDISVTPDFKVLAVTSDDPNENLIGFLRQARFPLRDNALLASSFQIEGATLQEAFNRINVNLGQSVNLFSDNAEIRTNVSLQLREGLSNGAGVNIDDTFLIVNQLQQSFSANARFFSVIDEMLTELLAAF